MDGWLGVSIAVRVCVCVLFNLNNTHIQVPDNVFSATELWKWVTQ